MKRILQIAAIFTLVYSLTSCRALTQPLRAVGRAASNISGINR